MSDRTLSEQLTKYLTDVHSIEVQALAQMKAAPDIAGDEGLAAAFREHLDETAEQKRLVEQELERRGADTSGLKDIAGRVGGWAMVAFAKLNPDTPGKLTAHAYSYEHMELAAYELLGRVAHHAGERLESLFDVAVEASLREKEADDIESELVSYLTDAHSIEAQSLQLLETGPALAGFDELAEVFRAHLEETREQRHLVEERLAAHDAKPSRFQNAGLRMGGINIGGFFGAQPDTPLKLAGFAFAFEHLEVAAYELLRGVAERAGDDETADVAERIAAEERHAAERVASTWDAAVDTAL